MKITTGQVITTEYGEVYVGDALPGTNRTDYEVFGPEKALKSSAGAVQGIEPNPEGYKPNECKGVLTIPSQDA